MLLEVERAFVYAEATIKNQCLIFFTKGRYYSLVTHEIVAIDKTQLWAAEHHHGVSNLFRESFPALAIFYACPESTQRLWRLRGFETLRYQVCPEPARRDTVHTDMFAPCFQRSLLLISLVYCVLSRLASLTVLVSPFTACLDAVYAPVAAPLNTELTDAKLTMAPR